MAERRTDSRSRSFLGAKIVFNSRNSSMDCLIRNISPTGARLLLSSAVVIPDEFELQIPKQGRSFRARLAWRRADESGVQFVEHNAEPPVPTELTIKLKQLEDEKAALRARVAQLSSGE
jgi:hypothetical protein